MRQTTIHLTSPCHESWEAMTPAATGRHCAACQKVVVDFTQMTDAEILAYLAKVKPHQVCGRLRASQMERPLVAAATGAHRWRTWLPALVAAVGLEIVLPAHVKAQATLTQTAAAEAGGPIRVAPAVVNAPPIAYRIVGTVLDGAADGSLPGATVSLEGTNAQVSTGLDGKFALSFTSTTVKVVILISYIGYKPARKSIILTRASKSLVIKLKPDLKKIGGISFTYPPPATLRQRLTRLFT